MFGLQQMDFFTIVEEDHTFQNPTSEAKLQQLIEYCELADGTSVLDIGCGKGWLLRTMAARYAIQGVGLELRQASIDSGEQMMPSQELVGSLEFLAGDAKAYQPQQQFDVITCLGASFAIGTFEDLLARVKPWLKPGGRLAVGDIYARVLPVNEHSAVHFAGGAHRTLADTAAMLDGDGLTLIALLDSSLDEWDRYESLHWRAAERWLREHPDHIDHQQFAKVAQRFKWEHIAYDREALGWSLFVARAD